MAFGRRPEAENDIGGSEMTGVSRSMMSAKNAFYTENYDKLMRDHYAEMYQPNSDFDHRLLNFKRIKALMLSEERPAAALLQEQISGVVRSMWSTSSSFSFVVTYDGLRLSLFVGGVDAKKTGHLFEGGFPGIEFDDKIYSLDEITSPKNFNGKSLSQMGFLCGNPYVKDYSESEKEITLLDSIVNGTRGICWAMTVTARPISYNNTLAQYHKWIEKSNESSEYVIAQYTNAHSGNVGESIATSTIYAGSKLYNKFAMNCAAVMEEALFHGQWSVNCCVFSDSRLGIDLVGGIFSSQLKASSQEQKRPFTLDYKPLGEMISGSSVGQYMTSDGSGSYPLSSLELAELIPLPSSDNFGLKISDMPEFDISAEHSGELNVGNILSGMNITDESYAINPDSLNRHALIIGLTGGGKTNTVKSLLYKISNLSVPLPFLIIEPAKKEYYELYKMGMDDLQIYTVGSAEGSSIRINPFECLEGVSLQSHIDAVFSAFKASFILYSPMPYVLETAIYEIYEDYGWDIETGKNIHNERRFPTIEDLYYKISPVVKSMGYDQRMQNDLIGSLTSRINSLRIGAKGNCLNVAYSTPISQLLRGRVVIELEDVGDEDAKAFIISLILMQVQEYRRSDETQHQLDVEHVLLIEEAHRLLKNIPAGSGENADPRGAAVEYFCNMLAELRSKGQGFIVIDQIPSKLAPDLIKNTNLKIIHRTVDREDRELVGGAMHMTEKQTEYLSCLKQGVAAVYSEGDERPKLVKLPFAGDIEKQLGRESLSRVHIMQMTSKNCVISQDKYAAVNQTRISRICAHCPNKEKCITTGGIENISVSMKNFFSDYSENIESNVISKLNIDDLKKYILSLDFTKISIADEKTQKNAKLCLLAYWISHYSKQLGNSGKASVFSNLLSDERIFGDSIWMD